MAEILDGNNLMGRLGGGTREGLLAELAELARRKRRKLTVVFDGPPGAGRPKVQTLGDVTVVHAAPRTADEEILRRIQESRDTRGQTVVTDDRALASAVHAAGARTLGVDDFRRTAASRMKASPPESEERKAPPAVSVRDWESWFSDPRNRIGS